MNHTFVLNLHSATKSDCFTQVSSFVGEDASGSFGIQSNHGRFMTSLVFGLARFKDQEGGWHYLAQPGGLLYFTANELTISTRRYLIDTDYERISSVLAEQLLAEEVQLHDVKKSLRQMEEQMLRRLWQMRRSGREV